MKSLTIWQYCLSSIFSLNYFRPFICWWRPGRNSSLCPSPYSVWGAITCIYLKEANNINSKVSQTRKARPCMGVYYVFAIYCFLVFPRQRIIAKIYLIRSYPTFRCSACWSTLITFGMFEISKTKVVFTLHIYACSRSGFWFTDCLAWVSDYFSSSISK
jgi:hypothetical protein